MNQVCSPPSAPQMRHYLLQMSGDGRQIVSINEDSNSHPWRYWLLLLTNNYNGYFLSFLFIFKMCLAMGEHLKQ